MHKIISFDSHRLCFLDSKELGRGLYKLIADYDQDDNENIIALTHSHGNSLPDILRDEFFKVSDVEAEFPYISDDFSHPKSLFWINAFAKNVSVIIFEYGSKDRSQCKYGMICTSYIIEDSPSTTLAKALEKEKEKEKVRKVPESIGRLC